ncbi:hypothetical protein Pve01_47190 [Planomonospora venezuelensis]|nr:hypothetical protein Pve01_47190 [Planomonospora venezuelensis]
MVSASGMSKDYAAVHAPASPHRLLRLHPWGEAQETIYRCIRRPGPAGWSSPAFGTPQEDP